MSATKPQNQEAQRPASRINAKRMTPRYIICKLLKIKDKVLKGGGKHLTYVGIRNYIQLLLRNHARQKSVN